MRNAAGQMVPFPAFASSRWDFGSPRLERFNGVPAMEINGEGAGIAVRKGETALADKFSAAIEAIRASGKYAEINKKYFDFDVYGN